MFSLCVCQEFYYALSLVHRLNKHEEVLSDIILKNHLEKFILFFPTGFPAEIPIGLF